MIQRQSKHFTTVVLSLVTFLCQAQPGKVIDQLAGVVGNKVILQSEVETQYQQFLAQGNYANEKIKCIILSQMLLNKLLLNQAILDSVEVTDAQVDEKIDRNMEYYIRQIGSKEKLEAFYGKTILELKEEYRPLVREQLQTQSMQQRVVKDVTASPVDVREFFNKIPHDSLPYINSEIEYGQIQKIIPIGTEEKNRVKEQLRKYRERIINGEDFAALAVLYSQDGSSKNGGELGFHGRGELVPEFEAAAFRLKANEVSDIVETKFGYHLIQMIERRGEQINARHILLKPQVSQEDLRIAKAAMDSVYYQVKGGSIKFEEAAEKFSDDMDTRFNGGNVFNPETGNTRFESDQVDPAIFFQLEKLQPGEVSEPFITQTQEGNQVYKIYYLKTRTTPHRANLIDDYQRLQEIALEQKQNKELEDWISRKKNNIYIHIAPEFLECENLKEWLN